MGKLRHTGSITSGTVAELGFDPGWQAAFLSFAPCPSVQAPPPRSGSSPSQSPTPFSRLHSLSPGSTFSAQAPPPLSRLLPHPSIFLLWNLNASLARNRQWQIYAIISVRNLFHHLQLNLILAIPPFHLLPPFQVGTHSSVLSFALPIFLLFFY
jgi:hypothetical protein